ncbi:MAG: hypothetical protein KBA66_22000 [Leptospiraceae bacterium]|nr:hypothetical protein [Leptospiraceae bacterium]
MRNNLFIENTEVSGIIFILLKKLIPINLNEYIKKMKDDTIDFSSESSFDFFTYNLKKYDDNRIYPSVYREDIVKPDFIVQYKKKYDRLYRISERFYSYHIQHTFENPNAILQYAKEQNANRLIVFKSSNIVDNYLRLIKILKLNSFAYRRELNADLSSNLYSPAGFIQNKKLNMLLRGKGKSVTDTTFKILQLVFDKELDSNLVTIQHIQDKKESKYAI